MIHVAPRPQDALTLNFGITVSNVIEDMLQPYVNTQTHGTLRTGSVITICLPLMALNTYLGPR